MSAIPRPIRGSGEDRTGPREDRRGCGTRCAPTVTAARAGEAARPAIRRSGARRCRDRGRTGHPGRHRKGPVQRVGRLGRQVLELGPGGVAAAQLDAGGSGPAQRERPRSRQHRAGSAPGYGGAGSRYRAERAASSSAGPRAARWYARGHRTTAGWRGAEDRQRGRDRGGSEPAMWRTCGTIYVFVGTARARGHNAAYRGGAIRGCEWRGGRAASGHESGDRRRACVRVHPSGPLGGNEPASGQQLGSLPAGSGPLEQPDRDRGTGRPARRGRQRSRHERDARQCTTCRDTNSPTDPPDEHAAA